MRISNWLVWLLAVAVLLLGSGGTGSAANLTSHSTRTAASSSAPASSTLYTWGKNLYEQLGDGTNIPRTSPVSITLAAGVAPTAIKGGYNHSLAIGSDGKLYAWGDNQYGQLGDGTTITRARAVSVSLATGVSPTAISAGASHSLAIGSDGMLYAWGANYSGQLGDGDVTSSQRNSPVSVTLAAGVNPAAIAAGSIHSLAIGSDGNLYAWGANYSGQLGDGTTISEYSPVSVTLAAGVKPTAIAGGDLYSLAIGNDGNLYAWGDDTFGQLGDGITNTYRTRAMSVTLAAGVTPTAIAAGGYHSVAIGSDGNLYTWGNNATGQLGDGTTTSRSRAMSVTLAAGVKPVAIAAGQYHSLAIGSDGKLYAWGYNNYGQLGDGTTTNRPSPVVVGLPAGATPNAIATGQAHSLAIVPPPAISISNVSHTEGNAGTTPFQFTVSLSYTASQTVTVQYATADGTATAAGNDYQPTSGTLTIPPGQISGTIGVNVNGDTTFEPDESFKVVLSNPTNATLGATSAATGTILNDDLCNELSVVAAGDDGGCGTLRRALTFASSNPTKTVTISLAPGTTINLTSGLTLTSGVSITTTAPCGVGAGNTMLPPITLQGVGASSGNGLTLAGNNRLYGLWIRGFSGVQLKAPPGSSTRMQCVKASKL